MSRKKRLQKRRARDKALAKKRVRRRTKSKRHSQSNIPSLSQPPFMGIPPAANLSAPKGFRPITMSQSMIEFAEPVMEFAETSALDDTNEALQVALLIWNYTRPSALNQTHSMRAKVVAQICTTLKMPLQEAEAFLDQMIERKAYLFPEEIQPEGATMTMFMRKEVEYLVTKFDAGLITL